MRPVHNMPHGIFRGSNFMTPNWLGYFKGTFAGKIVYVELSSGRGIYNDPIFGVTVRGSNGNRLDPDPSKLFHSRRAAQSYIDSGLTKDTESEDPKEVAKEMDERTRERFVWKPGDIEVLPKKEEDDIDY